MWLELLLVASALLVPAPALGGRLAKQKREARWQPAVLMVAVFVGVLGFLFFGRLSVAIAALSVGALVAWTVSDARRRSLQIRGEDAVAGYLGVVTSNLRAGAVLPVALRRGVEHLPDSAPENVREPLARAAQLAARGSSSTQALRGQPGAVATVGRLLEVSERHGIAVAGVLEQAQSRLDAVKRHRAATRASLQGPQATAMVLACLPVAGIAMGSVMGANPLGFLFGGGLGGVLLVIGVGLVVAGFVWSRLIIRGAGG